MSILRVVFEALLTAGSAYERHWYARSYESALRGRLSILRVGARAIPHVHHGDGGRRLRGLVHHTRGEIRRAQKIQLAALAELARYGGYDLGRGPAALVKFLNTGRLPVVERPRCPGCGGMPSFRVGSFHAWCDNAECVVASWNRGRVV